MTHTPLTKAEREELLGDIHESVGAVVIGKTEASRLLADLDAAEAKVRTQFQTTFDELRKALGSDIGSEGGLCAILTGIEDIRAQRDEARSKLAALLSAIESLDAFPHQTGSMCRTFIQQPCSCLAKPNRDALAAALAAARGDES